MSGHLLIGIAAVGVGWAWIHRNPTSNAAKETAETASGKDASDADLADKATTKESDGPLGLPDAVGVGDTTPGTSSVMGPAPVEGSDGGQVVAAKSTVEGAVTVDHMASSGGADPSTQQTAANSRTEDDEPSSFVAGDTWDTVLAVRFGKGKGRRGPANGLTRKQEDEAFRDSAIYTNEVF